MRIVIADGQEDVIAALRLLLTHGLGLEVVGEAADLQGLRAQVLAGQPELLLLEWELLGPHAALMLAALSALCARRPSMIVLSGRPEVRSLALAAGADAFLSKIDPPDQVLQALVAARRLLDTMQAP